MTSLQRRIGALAHLLTVERAFSTILGFAPILNARMNFCTVQGVATNFNGGTELF